MTTGPQDADELCQHRGQFADVGQRQGTYGDVNVLAGQGQLVQVALAELAAGDLCFSYGQHLGGAINADHRVAEGGQVLSVAAGAAGSIQRGTARQAIQDLPDDWLLQVNKPVPGWS